VDREKPESRASPFERLPASEPESVPAYIAYFVVADTIWIIAIAHGRRLPEYWLKRRKLMT
jgi:hypothetical protein